MKLRIVSLAACAAMLAAPAIAQSEDEDDKVDLESVDALFGDSVVTEAEEDQTDSAEEDAPEPDDEAIVSEEPPTEPNDLDRAYAYYSQCAADAGEELEAAGFATDDVGNEAVLRCSGARAAYVNAFYFSLIPRYPGLSEGEIRATAERLVSTTDEFLATKASEDAALARAGRPADHEVISE